jgi:hypothetical protein
LVPNKILRINGPYNQKPVVDIDSASTIPWTNFPRKAPVRGYLIRVGSNANFRARAR